MQLHTLLDWILAIKLMSESRFNDKSSGFYLRDLSFHLWSFVENLQRHCSGELIVLFPLDFIPKAFASTN